MVLTAACAGCDLPYSQLLVLKPVSKKRHIDDEASPYADGPVSYSFDEPYKTSFSREVHIPAGANPTLHRLGHLFIKRATEYTKACRLSASALIPSFAAIAKDEVGKVHVLPLTNLDTPLRALQWAAADGERESGREITINLVLFLQSILKSEVSRLTLAYAESPFYSATYLCFVA